MSASSTPDSAELAAELLALLTLRFTPGLGPRRLETLRRHFGGARAVLETPTLRLREVPGLDLKVLAAIGTPVTHARAAAELQRAEVFGTTLLGRGLPGYPQALEALGDPPPILWLQGELPQLDTVPRAIGVVGTRQASAHALSLAASISGELARAGVAVVSGLARGIDTAAHTAALDAGGPSVGILGSAVDQIYPYENKGLAARLAVLSEYPLGTRPAAHNFPPRNRLIAALSAGSLIVESAATSNPSSISPGPARCSGRHPARGSAAAPAAPPSRAARAAPAPA